METTIEIKNTEITFGTCINWSFWNIGFDWWGVARLKGNKNLDINLNILCFRFYVKIWRWKR
ncbi:hypothetical protein LCGC14_1396860 [marine sediment metagenome]|uniref:Uncharacterized protein n=1 Tax=marine sediment metagenome TaxID=412755 RepID=A0A0F9JYE8_9ZZZZ